jgi:hypothetical protein
MYDFANDKPLFREIKFIHIPAVEERFWLPMMAKDRAPNDGEAIAVCDILRRLCRTRGNGAFGK